MEKIASQILDKLKDPQALSSVLASAGNALKSPTGIAAGVSGLAGGVLTAGSAQRPGETPGGRRWRILRNALLAAGAGGGATALLQSGAHNLATALPVDDKDPVAAKLTSPLARGAYGAAGIAGMNQGIFTGKQVPAEQKDLLTKLRRDAPTDIAAAGLHESGPLNRSAMTGAPGAHVRNAINTALGGDSTMPNVQAIDNELLSAGLPVGRKLEGWDRVTQTPAFNRLFRAGKPLLNSGGGMLPPLARTAIGASAMFAPEIVKYLASKGTNSALDIKQ